MLNINHSLYKIFCTVVETRSISEASKKLFITESTISTHIKNLESQLDMVLFYREKNKLKLTDDGKKLYDAISTQIKDIEFSVNSIIEENDISKAKITIGCPSHISTSYLYKSIGKIRKDYPNITIDTIGAANYTEFIDKLRKHTVDFVVIDIIPPEAKNEIKVKPLKKMNNVFIYNKPLKINDLKELENYEFILNYDDSNSIKELHQVLNKKGIQIKSNIHSDITEMRIAETKNGMGIGYVIEDTVEDAIKNKELYRVELPMELPTVEINIAYMQQYLTKMDKIYINEYLKKTI